MALAGIWVLTLAAGCGRTAMAPRDGGGREVAASGIPDARAGAGEPPAEAPGPAEVAPERGSDLPGPDSGPTDVAMAEAGFDTAGPPDLAPQGCTPLANRGLLNLGYIKQARFAVDGRSLLVRIGAFDSDVKDDARLIELPSGASRVLWSGVRDVEWLGPSRALVTTGDNELVAVALDGSTAATSAGPTCSHAATPDSLRVYFTSSGCDHVEGPLGVLDVVTGTRGQIAANVSTSSLAVSPDSRWAAYVAGSTAIDAGLVHVVDATGSITRVSGAAAVLRPTFASGQILLFQSQGSGAEGTTVWRYDLANHATQALVDGDPGIAGYELAPDGSALLAAKLGSVSVGKSGELYLVPLDGASPVRLASDLLDYRMHSMVVRVFAFAPASKRILYIADYASDGGRSSGISSVATDGSAPISLSASGFGAVVSSYADRVALVAADRTLGRSTIYVVSADGARQFTVEVTGEVSFAGFVPRDRGLLYVQTSVDSVRGTFSELGHLSFTSGDVTRLGYWTASKLALSNYPVGISAHEYPVDPTGCYTVVDSDYSSTAAILVDVPD
jgi:Tol biopolymer transport system component